MSTAKQRVSIWMKIKKRSMNNVLFVEQWIVDVCILDMVNVYCCCFFFPSYTLKNINHRTCFLLCQINRSNEIQSDP